jgi:hypothetical protein
MGKGKRQVYTFIRTNHFTYIIELVDLFMTIFISLNSTHSTRRDVVDVKKNEGRGFTSREGCPAFSLSCL